MIKQTPRIAVKEKTKDRLDKLGSKKDTYDSIINKLIDIAEKINKK